jgi:hypothetical protein
MRMLAIRNPYKVSRTNAIHPQCYARALHDCSVKLSREHYVSASVLELLGDDHTIANASWLPPGEQSDPLPTGALGSKILCQRHNESLSPLDAHAKIFFTELLRALSNDEQAPNRRVSVDGDRLEQWVLKACCGALASGNLVEKGQAIVREPPRRWLEILFRESRWEQGAGLYIRQAQMIPHLGYAIGPVYVEERWVGGGIEFAGVEFFVLLDSGALRRILEQSSGGVSDLVFRPGAIRIESPTRRTEIEMEWQTWTPSEGVRYRRS